MAGLLIKELLMRGLLERILIITPGGLTRQWQEDEMSAKFNLQFTLANRSLFSSDPNIFHTSPRIVTSIDFISRDDVLNVALNSHWDMIIFDEAHNCQHMITEIEFINQEDMLQHNHYLNNVNIYFY